MKTFSGAILALFISTIPALAVTVNNPTNGATVNSPFTVSGSAATCSSQPVTKIGYSLDSGAAVISTKPQTIHMSVSAAPGPHTVHMTVWGDKGAACVKDVTVTVEGAVTGPVIATNAISVSNLQTIDNWKEAHDTGTSGTSTGAMSLVGTPSYSGVTREFATSYTNKGGERYSLAFAEDRTSTNFVYDGWIYIKSPATSIANLELDLNETMSNGQTVIFGFQCSAYSGTWEYSENLGTPEKPVGHWAASKAACNPSKWTTDTWHHVQITYSRDDEGHATYQSVYFDGVESPINATVLAARAMGWDSSVITNFQVDGSGASGSSVVYLSDLTVYRW